MVKKFTYLCDFAGQQYPVTFYIGNSAKGTHPIGFQSKWISKEKGGVVPQNLMDSLEKLKEIADTQNVPFEDLCEYVIKEVQLSQAPAQPDAAIKNNKDIVTENKIKQEDIKI